jgi:Xaa-Pro aminopeptidase
MPWAIAPSQGEIMTQIPRRDWRLGVTLIVMSILGSVLPASGWQREPLSVYHERRAKLLSQTGDGMVALFGYNEEDVAASVTTFHQNEQFYYLTGWNEPHAMVLLVPKVARNGEPAGIAKEILFIPAHDYRQEKWTGPKLGPDDPDAAARTGFPTVESVTLFASELQEALKSFPKIYTEFTAQPESGEDAFQQDEVSKLRKLAPLATMADLRPLLTTQREVKSPSELALIRKAADASVEAHLAAMKAMRPAMWEYEIASLMQYEFGRRGCEWPSYPPIVGSGFFSTVLHYDADDHQMQTSDVVVMDVAGSYSGYTSDITRTLPVSGHFTPRQREIYDVVLGAHQAVLNAIKPGVMLGYRSKNREGLQQIAYDYINSHGKDLHGNSLGRYFIHGIGHSVGLNVHDPANYEAPLQAGMVITDEPGIYIPEEKIGVRIEDMVLITPDGAELMTKRLPRTAEEIELLMKR